MLSYINEESLQSSLIYFLDHHEQWVSCKQFIIFNQQDMTQSLQSFLLCKSCTQLTVYLIHSFAFILIQIFKSHLHIHKINIQKSMLYLLISSSSWMKTTNCLFVNLLMNSWVNRQFRILADLMIFIILIDKSFISFWKICQNVFCKVSWSLYCFQSLL